MTLFLLLVRFLFSNLHIVIQTQMNYNWMWAYLLNPCYLSCCYINKLIVALFIFCVLSLLYTSTKPIGHRMINLIMASPNEQCFLISVDISIILMSCFKCDNLRTAEWNVFFWQIRTQLSLWQLFYFQGILVCLSRLV